MTLYLMMLRSLGHSALFDSISVGVPGHIMNLALYRIGRRECVQVYSRTLGAQ